MRVHLDKCSEGEEHVVITLTRDEADVLRDELPDPDFVADFGERTVEMYDRFLKHLSHALASSTAEAGHAR